jgi:hypothetical protein
MARTYYYSDVINLVAPNVQRSGENSVASHICNVVTNEIWTKFDWRESLENLPPFYLVPGEQDYGAPAAAVPSDYLGLRRVFYTNLNNSPVFFFPLTVMRDLDTTELQGIPHSITYLRESRAFRVFPRTPDNFGAPWHMITGTYKKRPQKITASNFTATLLPFDDIYLDVWVQGLKWGFWNLSGDERGPGQYRIFQAAIDEMASSEGLELADPSLSPREPLVPWYGAFD